jgi:hypothetical protein
MKKLVIFAATLAAAFILLSAAGASMEPRHVVSRTQRFAATPERVFTALLSIRQLSINRSDLKSMESAVEKDRLPPEVEVLGSPVRIEARELHAPYRLVVLTTEPGLGYSGTWSFDLAPENDATRLTVTEDAAIRSWPMRFVVGRILGEDVVIEAIFRNVARKVSETPKTTGGD